MFLKQSAATALAACLCLTTCKAPGSSAHASLRSFEEDVDILVKTFVSYSVGNIRSIFMLREVLYHSGMLMSYGDPYFDAPIFQGPIREGQVYFSEYWGKKIVAATSRYRELGFRDPSRGLLQTLSNLYKSHEGGPPGELSISSQARDDVMSSGAFATWDEWDMYEAERLIWARTEVLNLAQERPSATKSSPLQLALEAWSQSALAILRSAHEDNQRLAASIAEGTLGITLHTTAFDPRAMLLMAGHLAVIPDEARDAELAVVFRAALMNRSIEALLSELQSCRPGKDMLFRLQQALSTDGVLPISTALRTGNVMSLGESLIAEADEAGQLISLRWRGWAKARDFQFWGYIDKVARYKGVKVREDGTVESVEDATKEALSGTRLFMRLWGKVFEDNRRAVPVPKSFHKRLDEIRQESRPSSRDLTITRVAPHLQDSGIDLVTDDSPKFGEEPAIDAKDGRTLEILFRVRQHPHLMEFRRMLQGATLFLRSAASDELTAMVPRPFSSGASHLEVTTTVPIRPHSARYIPILTPDGYDLKSVTIKTDDGRLLYPSADYEIIGLPDGSSAYVAKLTGPAPRRVLYTADFTSSPPTTSNFPDPSVYPEALTSLQPILSNTGNSVLRWQLDILGEGYANTPPLEAVETAFVQSGRYDLRREVDEVLQPDLGLVETARLMSADGFVCGVCRHTNTFMARAFRHLLGDSPIYDVTTQSGFVLRPYSSRIRLKHSHLRVRVRNFAASAARFYDGTAQRLAHPREFIWDEIVAKSSYYQERLSRYIDVMAKYRPRWYGRQRNMKDPAPLGSESEFAEIGNTNLDETENTPETETPNARGRNIEILKGLSDDWREIDKIMEEILAIDGVKPRLLGGDATEPLVRVFRLRKAMNAALAAHESGTFTPPEWLSLAASAHALSSTLSELREAENLPKILRRFPAYQKANSKTHLDVLSGLVIMAEKMEMLAQTVVNGLELQDHTPDCHTLAMRAEGRENL